MASAAFEKEPQYTPLEIYDIEVLKNIGVCRVSKGLYGILYMTQITITDSPVDMCYLLQQNSYSEQ